MIRSRSRVRQQHEVDRDPRRWNSSMTLTFSDRSCPTTTHRDLKRASGPATRSPATPEDAQENSICERTWRNINAMPTEPIRLAPPHLNKFSQLFSL